MNEFCSVFTTSCSAIQMLICTTLTTLRLSIYSGSKKWVMERDKEKCFQSTYAKRKKVYNYHWWGVSYHYYSVDADNFFAIVLAVQLNHEIYSISLHNKGTNGWMDRTKIHSILVGWWFNKNKIFDIHLHCIRAI